MLEVLHSNRLSELVDALAERLWKLPPDPFRTTQLVVPNSLVDSYVKTELAARLGVAFNVRSYRPETLAAEVCEEAGLTLVTRECVEPRILSLLASLPDSPELSPVQRYLIGSGSSRGRDARSVQLANRLASLFEEYAWSRPDLLEGWAKHRLSLADSPLAAVERWQAALFQAIGGPELATPRQPSIRRAGELYVIGFSYFSFAFHELLASLATSARVLVLSFNPCKEFWADAASKGEARADENVLLTRLGRAGRDHVRALDERIEFNADARFITGPSNTLLSRLEDDVLNRRSAQLDGPEPDSSLSVWAVPTVRRAAETIVDEIWSLVSNPSTRPVSFSDVCIAIASNDAVIVPIVTAALEAGNDIPYGVVRRVAAPPMFDLATMLLELPFGAFTRRDVLAVLTHPSFLPGELTSSDVVRISAALGVSHGLDARDHEGTYIERDVLSWAQATARAALSVFAEPGPRGVIELSTKGDVALLTGPLSNLDELTKLVERSSDLLELGSVLRYDQRAYSDWADELIERFDQLLEPRDELEERDKERILSALDTLRRFDVDALGVPSNTKASGRLAAAQAKGAIEAARTTGTRIEGVTVAPMNALRCVPFRFSFVIGLDDATFPAPTQRDPIDLRAALLRPLDVSNADRDRYALLETILSTRDAIRLIYLDRDEATGDPLPRPQVIEDVFAAIARADLSSTELEGSRRPRFEHAASILSRALPPHRWESLPSSMPEAAREAAAYSLGSRIRESLDLGARALDPRRVLSRFPDDEQPELLSLLGLSTIPEAARVATPSAISAWALRRYLECPLQGSAVTALGLRTDHADEADVTDEIFDPRPFEVLGFLENALMDERPEESLEASMRAAELRGAFPTGRLGRSARDRLSALLDAIVQRARARRPDLARLRMTRRLFLPSAIPARESRVWVIPSPSVALGELTIPLIGTSALVTPDLRTSIHLVLRGLDDLTVLMRGLRAFIDQLFSAAAEDGAEEHEALFFGIRGRTVSAASIVLRRTEAGAARAELTRLAAAALEVHDELAPADPYLEIFLQRDLELTISSDEYAARVKARFGASAERRPTATHRGPVARVERFSVPDDVLQKTRERLRPYLSSIVDREGP